MFSCQTSNTSKRQNIRKTATLLLNHFGSLHNLFEADPLEICYALGEDMPEKTKQSIAILLSLIPHLYIRYKTRKLSGEILDTPKKAGEYFKALFHGKIIEHLYLMVLDKDKNKLGVILISKGTIDSSALYPREFVRAALRYKPYAHYAVLAHNHPSGSPYFSPNDITATVKATEALKAIGIRVIDHIIIADEEYISALETYTHPFD
jgi:DNA repair protein RadC